jgi:hypothetical protein
VRSSYIGEVVYQAGENSMAHRQIAPASVVTTPKSLWLAIVLATLFGPFGLFYATVPGAVLMLIAAIFLAMFTFGIGVFLVWPVSIVWATAAVISHNKKVRRGIAAAPQDEQRVSHQ